MTTRINGADSSAGFASLSRLRLDTLRSRNGFSLLAGLIVLVVVAWAVAPGLFTDHSPYVGITHEQFEAPSVAHPFGTDQLGRDVFARVVYGTRPAVITSLVAVAIGLVIGSLLGLVAGFFGEYVDAALGRLIDVLLAIPAFLLAVIVVVSLGFATTNAAIAVGASSVAVFARLSRSETLRVKSLAFVESAYLLGGNKIQILLLHVLPNTYRPILALTVLQFGIAIINISGLAFLGYGSPPPASDWGLQVADGKAFFYSFPWLVVAPGVVMVLTVLSLNQLSKSIGRRK
ncbi:ABC transporter permease [Tsukamurella sp. 8F]|uniref:ABC transporter permease n=1 Tax=Tsukamurella sp. 8F TaxID=3031961 RepID=UPI0023B9A8A7|nr:ABC transporter permease [Tsukamurella sp. 8F]MDF0586060.1 ABC transporter permease [Tsukamurella sp. 8F]